MDLRFALFERIARDSVLRRLLVNYADRLDDRGVLPGPAGDTCYLTMQWTTDNRTSTVFRGGVSDRSCARASASIGGVFVSR